MAKNSLNSDIFVKISKVLGSFELTNIIFWISWSSFRTWLLWNCWTQTLRYSLFQGRGDQWEFIQNMAFVKLLNPDCCQSEQPHLQSRPQPLGVWLAAGRGRHTRPRNTNCFTLGTWGNTNEYLYIYIRPLNCSVTVRWCEAFYIICRNIINLFLQESVLDSVSKLDSVQYPVGCSM